MTGRELIIYILQNNLEDKQIIEDGKMLGFMNVDEAAVEYKVGPETIKTWIDLGIVPGVKFGDEIRIPMSLKINKEVKNE